MTPIGSRSALRQRDPLSLRRHGREGELRASRAADGRGAHGLRAVDSLPSPQSEEPALVGSRPLRPLRGPWLGAALLAAPFDGLRSLARSAQAVPTVGERDAGASGEPRHGRRRSLDRPARAGRRQRTRHGDRRSPPRGALQPPRTRDLPPLHLRPRLRRRHDGGRAERGELARGSPRPRPPHRPLRQQPCDAVGDDADRLHRGRRRALPRLRLARAGGRRRQRPGRDRARDSERQGRTRPAVADLGADGARLWRARQAGHLRRARQPARRRRGAQGEAEPRLARGAAVLHSGRGAWPISGARRSRPRARRSVEPELDAYERDFPELAREIKRRFSGELPDGWAAELPASRPTPRVSRHGRRPRQ